MLKAKNGFFQMVLVLAAVFFLSLNALAGKSGALDRTFSADGKVTTAVASANGSDFGRDVAVQADGKIVVVGQAGATDFTVVRYNRDGSLDTTFDGDGKVTTDIAGVDDAFSVQILSDGKILVAGFATNAGTGQDFALVRYNSDGSLDTTFDTDGKVTTDLDNLPNTGRTVLVQTDGKYLVCGRTGTSPSLKFSAARYNTNGSLDTTFDTDGKVVLTITATDDLFNDAMLQTNNGRIIMVGTSIGTGFGVGSNDFTVVRLLANGALDTNFDMDGIVLTDFNGGADQAMSVAIQADNKIVVAGSATLSTVDFAVARYNLNGSLDTSFDLDGKRTIGLEPGSNDFAASVLIQTDGKIVTAGQTDLGGDNDFMVSRINADGSQDPGFNGFGSNTTDFADFSDTISGALLQADGKLLVVGNVNVTANNTDIGLARYNTATENTFCDYDGDDRTDLSIFRPSNGQWWLNRSFAGVIAATFGTSTDKIMPADYTGDSKTDIAFFRPATSEWFILRSEDSTFYGFAFGTTGDVPVPGDYDGDGKADQAVFRPSTTTWYINNSLGGTTITAFGVSGDIPVAADYDGDNKTDIAIYRPSNGQWWLNRSTSGVIAATFGVAADKPVQADYTGDGKTDIAFFRPSTNEWFILRSEDFSFYGFPFGASGDQPAPGDYDGDGKSDAAIFRSSTSTWFINGSTAGSIIQTFGISGDKPTPGAFVP
jgi:uncharacterized delta-60 repeat protein